MVDGFNPLAASQGAISGFQAGAQTVGQSVAQVNQLVAQKRQQMQQDLQVIGALSLNALGGKLDGTPDPVKFESGLDVLENAGVDVSKFRGKPELARAAASASLTAAQRIGIAQREEDIEREVSQFNQKLDLERERLDLEKQRTAEAVATSRLKRERITKASPSANTRADGKPATGKPVTFVDPKSKKRVTVRQDSQAVDTLLADGFVPEKTLSAETAGRFGLIKTGLDNLKKARKTFLRIDPKTGKPRELGGFLDATGTFIIETAQTQLSAGELGRAQRAVRVAVEGALRAATGAAAPETEVQRALDQFMPNPTDTLETRTQKLDLLEQFLRNTQAAIAEGVTPSLPGDTPDQTVTGVRGDKLTTPGGNTFRVVR